jgi:hypothetical protein
MYGGAKLWNDLPGVLKDKHTLIAFKSNLKKTFKTYKG